MNFRQPVEVAEQSPYILVESAVNFDYPVHLFLVDPFEGDSPGIQILYITEFEGKTLVALPQSAWHRLITKRAFPATGLTKATLVEVVAARFSSRSVPDPVQKLRVWVGFLKPGFEVHVHTDVTEYRCDHFFNDEEEDPWLPFAQSLIDASHDHFAFFSAEGERVEDDAEDGSQMNEEELLEDVGLAGALEARVKYLEDTLQSVHVGMEEMVKLQRQSMGITPANPGRASALKKKEQSAAAGLPTAKAVPKSKQKDKYPLLDRGVVQAALQAGVPESNLLEMQRLLGSNVKASRVKDVNVNFTMDPLSEEEGGEDVADQEAAGSGLVQEPVSKDPVHNALHKLTTTMEVLTHDKVKKTAGSRLEQALDSAASSSGDTQSLGSGRKNAAARRALRTIFQEQPQEISAVIERLMFEDLNSQTLGPGQLPQGLNARSWVEFRSRIGNFKTPAHCSWSAAGILDSLIAGDVPKARARCGLLLLQLDQASIDRGGWGLASELSLEGLPPYSALANHTAPLVSEGEQPFSRLLDARWAEISLQFLKDQDDYLQRRKNIGRMTSAAPTKTKDSEEIDSAEAPRRRPKPKAKAKAASSQQDQ